MDASAQYEQQNINRYIQAYRAGASAGVASLLREAAEYDRLNPGRGLRQRIENEAFRNRFGSDNA